MVIAGRIIGVLLAAIAVLGLVLTMIPHPSAASTPIVGGNYWVYLYDDTESGVRVNGSIKMQVDNTVERVVMGQSTDVHVISITGIGTISGYYLGYQVAGTSTTYGNQIRLVSNFSLVSDSIVTMTNETVIGVGGPVSTSKGHIASYSPAQNDYAGDDDHGIGCVMKSMPYVTGTAWSNDGYANESLTLENDTTMILRVLESGVSVTTPAGTFSCHRISATLVSGNESESSILYYSDRVGNYVLMEGEGVYFGSILGDLALESYSYTMDATKPVAMAGKDRTAEVGHEFTFDAEGSSDNIGIVNYTWSFVAGSGTGALHRLYGQVVHFTFEDAREHKVILSVTDAAGNVDYDEMVVTVEKTGGISAALADNGVLIAFGVMLVLAAVLIVDGLFRRRRRIGSLPPAQQKPPSPKA